MRLKHVKGAEDRIAESPYVLDDEEARAGTWHEIFGNNNPIYLEIGMGKGKFILENAKLHPEINYVGMEKYPSVILRAIEKRQSEEYSDLKNIQFLCVNAEHLNKIFDREEVSHIYLNFSDPWPKERHAKRRLTSRWYFKRYADVLKKGGLVEFKTDNPDLFTFSLEEVEASGWNLVASTIDLHNDPVLNEGNIMTEYEQKFSEQGHAICKLIAENK